MPRSPKNGNGTAPRRRRAATRRKPGPVLPPTRTAIELRAYELFLMRGGEHGRDFDDWLTAERELRPMPPPQ
jgi:hypothetical protein